MFVDSEHGERDTGRGSVSEAGRKRKRCKGERDVTNGWCTIGREGGSHEGGESGGGNLTKTGVGGRTGEREVIKRVKDNRKDCVQRGNV